MSRAALREARTGCCRCVANVHAQRRCLWKRAQLRPAVRIVSAASMMIGSCKMCPSHGLQKHKMLQRSCLTESLPFAKRSSGASQLHLHRIDHLEVMAGCRAFLHSRSCGHSTVLRGSRRSVAALQGRHLLQPERLFSHSTTVMVSNSAVVRAAHIRSLQLIAH